MACIPKGDCCSDADCTLGPRGTCVASACAYELRIAPNRENSGVINLGAPPQLYVGATVVVGLAGGRVETRGYLQYPFGTLPASATVVSAELRVFTQFYFEACKNRLADTGPVLASIMRFGTLDVDDFKLDPNYVVGEKVFLSELKQSTGREEVVLNVADWVEREREAATGYLGIRLLMRNATNAPAPGTCPFSLSDELTDNMLVIRYR